MNEKKERKGKKILLSCIAVALVAAISVGTTLALSKAQADELTNTFTTPGIDLRLIEKTWDGDDDGDGSGVDPTNTALTANKTAGEVGVTELGKEQANGYTSGEIINKDPLLKNTCNYDEYVALKLDYYIYKQDADGNNTTDKVQVKASEFKSKIGSFSVDENWVADTTYNNDNPGSELYYYKESSGAFKVLDGKSDTGVYSSTDAIFTTVKVEAGDTGSVLDINNITVTWKKLPKFEIVVTGYAVQADNLHATTDVETIKNQLQSLITND